jgi:hypothetical protein
VARPAGRRARAAGPGAALVLAGGCAYLRAEGREGASLRRLLLRPSSSDALTDCGVPLL